MAKHEIERGTPVTLTATDTDFGPVEVEVVVYRTEVYVEVRAANQAISIETMELQGRELQIRLGPDWNRA